jgi:hypothetical protein
MGVCFSNNNQNRKIDNNFPAGRKRHINTHILYAKEKEKYVFYKNINEEINIYAISTNKIISSMNKNRQVWVNMLKDAEKILENESVGNQGNQEELHKLNNLTDVNNTNFHYNVTFLIELFYQKDKAKIKKNLIKGPPNNLRWSIWMGVALAEESIKKLNPKISSKNLIEESYSNLLNEKLSEKLSEQINKDLHRTAPTIKFFQSAQAMQSLFNVLKALTLSDKELGYCQGINILAANLLLVSDGNESETFFFLKFLFSNQFCSIREFFTRGFPKLHMFLHICKKLIKLHLPNIFDKLEDIIIQDEVWIFKWLQSLFSLTLDFSIGVRLWDCIIAEGIEFILIFTLAFLKFYESQILLAEDMVEFVEIFTKKSLSDKSLEEIIDIREKLITLTQNFKINLSDIESLKNEYRNDKNIVNIYFEEGSFYSNKGKQVSDDENENRKSTDKNCTEEKIIYEKSNKTVENISLDKIALLKSENANKSIKTKRSHKSVNSQKPLEKNNYVDQEKLNLDKSDKTIEKNIFLETDKLLAKEKELDSLMWDTDNFNYTVNKENNVGIIDISDISINSSDSIIHKIEDEEFEKKSILSSTKKDTNNFKKRIDFEIISK